MPQKTILVVDDDYMLLQNIILILELYGFSTLRATGAREALEIIALNKPNLIISDVMMGDIDGFQFLKLLKENISYRDIPVILLTALADVVDKNKGMSVGAQAFITKPFNSKELVKTINQLLK